jgi:hypothetical protein
MQDLLKKVRLKEYVLCYMVKIDFDWVNLVKIN